jgi:hypothetical protein
MVALSVLVVLALVLQLLVGKRPQIRHLLLQRSKMKAIESG